MGSISIAKIPTDTTWKANDTGASVSSIFKFKLNGVFVAEVSTKEGAEITGLNTTQKHTIAIYADDKRVSTIFLDFGTFGSNNLCLWYRTFYGIWNLQPLDESSKCAHQK